jgi:hypothetical protein
MLMVVILVNQMLLKVALNTITSTPKYFCHPIIVSRFRIVPIEGEQPPKIEGKVGTTYSPVTYKVRFVDW